MLQKLSLKSRLLLLVALLCGLSVLVGTIGFVSLRMIGAEYRSMSRASLPKLLLVKRMEREFLKLRIQIKALDSKSFSLSETSEAVKAAKDCIENFEKFNDEYDALGVIAELKGTHNQFVETWKDYKAKAEAALNTSQSSSESDQAALSAFFRTVAPQKAKAFMAASAALIERHQSGVDEKILEAEKLADRSNLVVGLVIFLGCLAGLAVGYAFAKSLAQQLGLISKRLGSEVDRVEHTATSIANTSDQLSAGSIRQATALQETSASLEETGAMVSKNAANASHSAESSNNSQNTVAKGKQAVEAMLTAMNEISQGNDAVSTQVETSNHEIENIVKLIKEIGDKTKVINDIVFQTKLLSFNASVEAARAGDHGKGFAVVAEEVGNLARMSGDAAKEISEMLNTSVTSAESIVANSKERVGGLLKNSQAKVARGLQTAAACEELLEAIVSNVTQVGTMVLEISSASDEQAKGLQEITKAMSQLDQVAQQTSLASQTTATSASELNVEVKQLRMVVGSFNHFVHGSAQTSVAASLESDVPEQVPVARDSKVIDFKPRPQRAKSQPPGEAHSPSGSSSGSSAVPSAADPRFKDV